MLDIVVKPWQHDKDRIVQVRTGRLGSLTSYDKRATTIDFQVQWSKVKVTH